MDANPRCDVMQRNQIAWVQYRGVRLPKTYFVLDYLVEVNNHYTDCINDLELLAIWGTWGWEARVEGLEQEQR